LLENPPRPHVVAGVLQQKHLRLVARRQRLVELLPRIHELSLKGQRPLRLVRHRLGADHVVEQLQLVHMQAPGGPLRWGLPA